MKVDIIGRTLIGLGLPQHLRQALEDRWLFPEHRLFTEHQATVHPYRIEIGPVDQGEAVALRPEWAHTEAQTLLGMSVPVEVRANDAGFWYQDTCGTLDCRHHGTFTTVRLQLCPDTPVLSLALLEALHLAVAEGLRCSGLLPLHVSAAVLGGQTCLFSGPSGRGKSTTLLQAVRAGGLPVAEDLVWYDPGSCHAYGWERAVRLLQSSLEYLPPEVAASGWPLTGDGKINVPYSAFRSSPVMRGGSVPGRFMMLTRDPEGEPQAVSALQPLSARDAALAVWEAAGLPLATQARQQVPAAIQRLLSHTEFFRLHLGSTPLPLTLPLPLPFGAGAAKR